MGNYTSMSLLDKGKVKTMLWSRHLIVSVRILVDDFQRSEAEM